MKKLGSILLGDDIVNMFFANYFKMNKISFFRIWLTSILLAFIGCSQEVPAVEEMDGSMNTSNVKTDLSSKLALNRPGDDANYAYVLLSSKSSLVSQMTGANTIYEIQTNFDLGGATLKVPSGCILRFNGGALKNGTVTFDNTYIEGLVDFSGCSFAGSLINKEVALSWFGAKASEKDNSTIINQVLDIIPETLVLDSIYPINKTIVINHGVTLRGLDWTESIYAIMVKNGEYGIKTSSNITAIKFTKYGSLNAYGISILGNDQLYIGGNTRDTGGPNNGPIQTCGILITTGAGSLSAMADCSIVGFTYGIRAIGGYIERIRSTYFSACRFGMYCCYTSDFICQDCHFNTNMLNYDVASHKLLDNNPNGIRKIGAGVLLKGTGMTQFLGCRFEFNFIHFIIDEAAIILNLQNCIFDAATHSSIFLYNDDTENMLVASERHTPSINCVNISDNTFARGSRCEHYKAQATPGSAIVYVRESNNRGSNISFSNNVVVDDIEVDQTNVQYEETIFRIYNDGTGGVINSNNNDFSHCKAKTVAAAVTGSKGRFTIKDNGSNYGSISHQFQNNSVIDIQKMEVNSNGKIVIWNTLTNGNVKSEDKIIDPSK